MLIIQQADSQGFPRLHCGCQSYAKNEPFYIPKQLRNALMVRWPCGPVSKVSISDAVKSDPEFQAAWNGLVWLSDNSEERAKTRFYESHQGYERNPKAH